MKLTVFVVVAWVVAAWVILASAGCSPLDPSPVCTTQPREYVLPTGVVQWEVDTYAPPVGERCPAIPIS